MRWLSVALVFCLCAGLGIVGAEDKNPTISEELDNLRKEVSAANKELSAKFNKAKTDQEKEELRAQFTKVREEVGAKALQLTKNNAKEEGVVDAVLMALNYGNEATAGEAATLLVENFSDSPKFTAAIPALLQSTAGRAAIAKLAEKSDDKEKKAQLLINLLAAEIENTDYPRTGKPVPADEAAKIYAAAADKLDKLAKEYGEVKITSGRTETTVAEKAKSLKAFVDTLVVGKVAPDVECETLEGKKQKLSDFRGKVVVLDIWATWCGPCVAMIPHERELVEKLKDKPFALISVSADAKKETLEGFLEKQKMPWTHWWNGQKGGVLEAYQVRFFPTIYVIDAKGVIRAKHVRGPALDAAVEKLLKEMETASK
jgi:thiol-disulfide isomerase/thioredoxin